MRKPHSISLCSLLAMCAAVFSIASTGAAQPSAGTALPGDPNAHFRAALAANGLPEDGIKPWHIKISFTLKDEYGKVDSQGTFEEFWAGPEKFKRVFASTSFSQVEYTTAADVRRTGNPNSAPTELVQITDQFLHPFSLDQSSIDAAKLQMSDLALGATELTCLSAGRAPTRRSDMALNSTFCVSKDLPILRLTLSVGAFTRTIRNGMIKFEGHYLPQTVDQFWSASEGSDGKQLYEAKLEAIEAISSADDAQFTPPPDSVPPPKIITLDARVTFPQRLHHAYPQYDYQPPEPHRSIQSAGAVGISVRIHSDGSVSPVAVVGGPLLLRQPSLEAVRKWTYKPFTKDGEPVEVNTTAFLVYSLSP
jgi:Gram-negative bacterial TonB protein C-terminal